MKPLQKLFAQDSLSIFFHTIVSSSPFFHLRFTFFYLIFFSRYLSISYLVQSYCCTSIFFDLRYFRNLKLEIPHLSFAIFSLVNFRHLKKKYSEKFSFQQQILLVQSDLAIHGNTWRIISNLIKKVILFFFSSFFFNFCHFLLGRKKIFSENFQMKFYDLHFRRFIFHLLDRHFMNGHLSTFRSFYIIYHQFRLNRPS